jgi:hypothetical protein
MHPRTLATIEQLEKPEWFTRVGHSEGIDYPGNLIVVGSWEEAVEHCTSAVWDDLILEAMNQYRERLFERSPERFKRWNDVVDMVKPVADELGERKSEKVVQEHNLPPGFVGCVCSDMLGILLEAEYADVYPPGFFASNGYWYIKGHFPCGWEGNFPEGRLVVY